MIYATRLLCCAAMMMANNASAEGVNHDVTGYDIAGITLGMGSEEAIAKITELTGVAFEDMSTGFPQDNPVTGQAEITRAGAETEDFEIVVGFTAAVPLDETTPLVVSQVTFTMPGTPENVAAMKSRAIEKYGTPTRGSADEPPHFRVQWCNIPDDQPNASCAAVPGASLTLDGGFGGRELKLFDIGYANAVTDFVNGENSSTPKF